MSRIAKKPVPSDVDHPVEPTKRTGATPETGDKPPEMRDADIANGENPDT